MSSQQRLLIMIPLLLGAAWLALFGDTTPSDEVAEAVVRPAASVEAPAGPAVAEEPEEPEGDLLRLQPRAPIRALIDSPDARDLFAASATAQPGANEAPPPAVAPAPPPIPFLYIGREYKQQRWVYFLEREGRTLLVEPGASFEGFRLEAATEKELTLLDLNTRNRQLIPIAGE